MLASKAASERSGSPCADLSEADSKTTVAMGVSAEEKYQDQPICELDDSASLPLCVVDVGFSSAEENPLEAETCSRIERVVTDMAKEYNNEMTSDPARQTGALLRRISSTLADTFRWKASPEIAEEVEVPSGSSWKLAFALGKALALILWLTPTFSSLDRRRPGLESLARGIQAGIDYAGQVQWRRLTSITIHATRVPARVADAMSGTLGGALGHERSRQPHHQEEEFELLEMTGPGPSSARR